MSKVRTVNIMEFCLGRDGYIECVGSIVFGIQQLDIIGLSVASSAKSVTTRFQP